MTQTVEQPAVEQLAIEQSKRPLSGRGRRLRDLATRLTTPLLPDDYLQLINPLWSSRELRAKVEDVVPQADDAATLVLRPGWGWSFDHQPGQYVGIGVQVGGRWHWRSYSLTSPAVGAGDLLEVTVKAMPEGFVSDHLVRGLEPGTIVRLAAPQGDFVLPDPPPGQILFLAAGSGITPILSMLRTLDRRGSVPDVVLVHTAPDADAMLFREEIRELADRHPGLTVVEHFSRERGRLSLADTEALDAACPDWRNRAAWACGPEAMLDAAERLWDRSGQKQRLRLERFSATLVGGGESGSVTFARSGRSVEVDGATTLLEAGERDGATMPAGCRMGICHTCVVPLVSGTVRDLRSGNEITGHESDAPPVQTCVSAAVGDCVLDV
ncbi:MAG TPA: ferredoxin reductase [Frankiaceae bacterium]|nr:ferredoxin reductase [Frankiaceae bacterium]